MLKHSYGSIIKSLVAMQNRRSKKKAAKEAAAAAAAGGEAKSGRGGECKPTFLTTVSTMDACKLASPSCLVMKDKYDIERFVNPLTREETFQLLFDEVRLLCCCCCCCTNSQQANHLTHPTVLFTPD